MRKIFSKRSIIIAAVVAGVIIAAIIATLIIRQVSSNANKTIIKDPGYATILPEGKTIVELGGWVRVSRPKGTAPVYAYNDTLTGVPISVSEQPLPESFKDNSVYKVAELAKSDNATATLAIGDITIFIGTSAKGPQSVYFTKSDLLILIKSTEHIENAAWSSYVSSLQ